MKKIDAFAHALPQHFATEMKARNPAHGISGLMSTSELWDLENRVGDLDEFGIDEQVLTLARPGIWNGLTADEALDLTQLANNGICDMAAEHPDRLIPVATLPFLTAPYLDELERCVTELGMAGVQVFTSTDGRPVDDPSYCALYDRAVDLDVPIWIHPRSRSWFEWEDTYDTDNIFGWPFDTSAAITRLVLSGTLDRYPDLQVITHHLGGVIPHLEGRIRSVARRAGYDVDAVCDGLRRTYADTATKGSVHTLQCGLDFYGNDTIVFGTDYPFGPENGCLFLRETIDAVERVEIPANVREDIFSGNLRAIL